MGEANIQPSINQAGQANAGMYRPNSTVPCSAHAIKLSFIAINTGSVDRRLLNVQIELPIKATYNTKPGHPESLAC